MICVDRWLFVACSPNISKIPLFFFAVCYGLLLTASPNDVYPPSLFAQEEPPEPTADDAPEPMEEPPEEPAGSDSIALDAPVTSDCRAT